MTVTERGSMRGAEDAGERREERRRRRRETDPARPIAQSVVLSCRERRKRDHRCSYTNEDRVAVFQVSLQGPGRMIIGTCLFQNKNL